MIRKNESVAYMNISFSTEQNKPKKMHLEFLRFLCIWLVMFTHTATAGFSLYLVRPESLFFPLYILVPFYVKIAVPIFFIISGALLLPKEESITSIFKKRIYRFIQVIFIFSLINYIYFYHNLPLTLWGHVEKFFTLIYTSHMVTAYYFLYIYVAFLLMLPIWRVLVKHLTNQLFLYLIGLHLFFVGIVPIISFLIFKGTAEINGFINPILAISEPTFYFLIGYWIENKLPSSYLNKRNMTYLGIASFIGTVIAASMTYYHGVIAGGLTEAISERFYDSFLFINTAFVYCATRYWFIRHEISTTTKNILLFLGSTAFGVMLLEEITRALTHPFFTHILLTYLPRFPFIDAILWISSAYALGILFTYLIKKTSYFKHLI